MNKLTFSIIIRLDREYWNNGGHEDYEVQPYIDGRKLLNRRDNIGLEPQKFLSANELLQEGRLLLGICTCGCEGCNDFVVEQKIKDNVVLWKVEDKTYSFDLLQYENAVKDLERNAIRTYEKVAERLATDLLKNTSPCLGYEFIKAVASVENKEITVYYGNGETSLSYVIYWNGKYEYGEHITSFEGERVVNEVDETGNACSNIRDFINGMLFKRKRLTYETYNKRSGHGDS